MSITIKDVANYAKVAPSTVSRVIADSPRISEKTKQRVREAMKELGYHPNLIARSLASKTTSVLGLVMPESADVIFQNPFFSTVLQGLSECAHEKMYALQMTTGKTEDEILLEVEQMVQGRRVDGIILLSSHVDDKLMDYLLQCDFPFVVVGKPFKNAEQITHVDNDNFRAAKEATEYLIQLNHKKIAFIGGSLNLVVTIDRLLGYEKALRDAGIELNNRYIVHEEFLQKGGSEAITELLKNDDPPTALVVADDVMALGVMKKLDENGVSVPEEISIVGFNNVLFAEMAKPPLSSVDINILTLGYEAAKNLILHIENPKELVKRVIIPHELIKRSSCVRIN